ncbi:MAG: hypothetical protein WC370_08385 [Dehalococcoidales bacterium]|jgi:hypothetical protein
MVQIWLPDAAEDSPLAYGLAVGDGSQILTVINYEGDIPDDLLVGLPGKTRYHASVQAIDPRNSATLLKLEDAGLPAIVIGAPDAFKSGSEVVIYGWPGPDYNKLEKRKAFFRGYGFIADQEEGTYVAYPGAAVTDKDGKVIGVIGTFYDAFTIRLGYPGMTPPVIDIHDALELLSPDATGQPWAKGPVYSLITTRESVTGRAPSAPPPENFIKITMALQSLFSKMGETLPDSELPTDYRSMSWGAPDTLDGTLFTVTYPRPVELLNTSGRVVTEARWVSIQWGRGEDKENRAFYGHFNRGSAVVDGGFLLSSDTAELENAITPID